MIIKDAVKVISEKMETEKEIQTMIASKKLEFEIMSMNSLWNDRVYEADLW